MKSVYMRDVDLPTCMDDCEFEDGIAPCAGNTREKMASRHILLIATPEHSKGHTSLSNKPLDWVPAGSQTQVKAAGPSMPRSTRGCLFPFSLLHFISDSVRAALRTIRISSFPQCDSSLAVTLRSQVICQLPERAAKRV